MKIRVFWSSIILTVFCGISAFASSLDLWSWCRLGLITAAPTQVQVKTASKLARKFPWYKAEHDFLASLDSLTYTENKERNGLFNLFKAGSDRMDGEKAIGDITVGVFNYFETVPTTTIGIYIKKDKSRKMTFELFEKLVTRSAKQVGFTASTIDGGIPFLNAPPEVPQAFLVVTTESQFHKAFEVYRQFIMQLEQEEHTK